MALFRCRSCHVVYEDYYPTDDSCLRCKRGLIRIVTKPDHIKQPKEE